MPRWETGFLRNMVWLKLLKLDSMMLCTSIAYDSFTQLRLWQTYLPYGSEDECPKKPFDIDGLNYDYSVSRKILKEQL